MNRSLLDKAQDRAQRRFRAMLDGHTYPDALAPETRLYVQSERLVDALLVEAQWEAAKGAMDALIDADREEEAVREYFEDPSARWHYELDR